ncbi:hypothetical protein HCA58_02030 [Micromonospora sp. HNM0581]|uniref:hypothetical protein n=1 Tax=Micromonospora sp. HNM0581 TaxID=2716341 RepID=UPI00146E9BE0|nr:hypothetical protein [Micromonospora sp. HNM0581]NLU77190.1 hypothetical protein [Micromonospora sp. HNM0581]
MAQRSSSGRGGTATRTRRQGGDRTPNTPRISESEIARMRVDDLRGQLRRHGVSGISALRKPELVKTLVKTLRAGGAGRRGSGPAGRAASTKKAGTAGRTTGAARRSASGAARTGRSTSRSVRSSQLISSLQDRPERLGRSLVTTSHDVIRRWARERGAKPATVSGTERAGRIGVLTFNMPGYRESSRIREITWDEWFHTFDLRKLNLIYQEQMRDGRQSNFFRTESPDREDG